MELNSTDPKMKSGGLGESRAYSFEQSGFMFDSVFKNLYSDPIGSIVRELYTNAMEVSPPGQPPHLTVPSFIAPTFILKDFGPGLSRDDMFNLYTVAGASTKRTSNQYVGAFGLGAKSPFAYCDSYTVTSRHGGTATTYLVHRNKERIPTMSEVSFAPCGTDTGLTIAIGVRTSDIGKWEEAICQYQLIGMPIKPFLLNTTKSIAPMPELIFAHKNVAIRAGNSHCTSFGLLRMGGPIYPINGMSMASGLFIDAPIGAVELTPSRESLVYSQRTNDYIKACVDEFYVYHSKAIKEEFDKCSTYFEACKLQHDYTKGNKVISNGATLPTYFQNKLIPQRWNGHHLREWGTLVDLYEIVNGKNSYHTDTTDPTNSKFRTFEYTVIVHSYNKFRETHYSSTVTLHFCEAIRPVIYLVDPADKYWKVKLRNLNVPLQDGIILRLDKYTPQFLDKLKTTFAPIVDFIEVSSISYVRPKIVRTKRAAITLASYQFPVVRTHPWRNIIYGSSGKLPGDADGFYAYAYRNTIYMDDTLPSTTYKPGGIPFTGSSVPLSDLRKLEELLNLDHLKKLIYISPAKWKAFAKLQKSPDCKWKSPTTLLSLYLQAAYDKLWGSTTDPINTLQNKYYSLTRIPSFIVPKYQADYAKLTDLYTKFADHMYKVGHSKSRTLGKYSAGDIEILAAAHNITLIKPVNTLTLPAPVANMAAFDSTPECAALVRYLTALQKVDPYGSNAVELKTLIETL